MKNTHFFLGANSAEGFSSLYDQLLTAGLSDLMILKGGPGCGKSTFMRRAAAAMEEHDAETVYIHCSGDPASLDAVLFPALRAGIVDGTAPHVLEPKYVGARERYVDLSPAYDVLRVKEAAPEIIACTDAYRAAYGESYHVLRALGGVESERRSIAGGAVARERLLRRAAGIAARELRGGKEEAGRTFRAFLGGMTHLGPLCRFDSVDALCPRVYELCDSYGLGAPMLALLYDAAREAGEDAILGMNPDRPAELQHLLLPGRGLAFITTNDRQRYEGKPYRRIRLDAMAEEPLSRAERARLRFLRRISRALEEEAVDALARAKRGHDALERLYHPTVDFHVVDALCEKETRRLLERLD